jgi:hypothetical protein
MRLRVCPDRQATNSDYLIVHTHRAPNSDRVRRCLVFFFVRLSGHKTYIRCYWVERRAKNTLDKKQQAIENERH